MVRRLKYGEALATGVGAGRVISSIGPTSVAAADSEIGNCSAASEDSVVVGVGSPGCKVICGPDWTTVSDDGLGRYIDCWLDAVPPSSSPLSPSNEVAASAPPLTSNPTTTPTPTSATRPETIRVAFFLAQGKPFRGVADAEHD